jgi:hypothetical protein
MTFSSWGHIVDRYPEVQELADLPKGWYARRTSELAQWVWTEFAARLNACARLQVTLLSARARQRRRSSST